VAARTGFVTAGSARLHFRDVGEGPAVVVLHGGPDFDYDYLLPELDRLAGRFRLVYYDQRGRGRSADRVRPDEVTIESEMDDLDRVLRHLGLGSVAVLGHSWGGVLALEYATRRPDRLTHLILLNTAPASYRDRQLFRQHLGRVRPAGDAEAMRSLAATAAFRAGDIEVETAYYRIHYRPAVRSPELLDRLLPRLRANYTPERVLAARVIEDRLYEQTWSSPGYDLLPGLRRLAKPTLVLHGADDFVPVEVAARVAAAIPTARLAVVPGCGHFAYLEAPGVSMVQLVAVTVPLLTPRRCSDTPQTPPAPETHRRNPPNRGGTPTLSSPGVRGAGWTPQVRRYRDAGEGGRSALRARADRRAGRSPGGDRRGPRVGRRAAVPGAVCRRARGRRGPRPGRRRGVGGHPGGVAAGVV
jgi:proline iminopeptidase